MVCEREVAFIFHLPFTRYSFAERADLFLLIATTVCTSGKKGALKIIKRWWLVLIREIVDGENI